MTSNIAPEKVLLKEYKNGNKLWKVKKPCMKCGGSGYIPFYYSISNGVCFDCNGTGYRYEQEREYTPENLAKQEAKLAEEARNAEENRKAREAQEAIHKAEEAKHRGHYYGEVGQKVEIWVTFTFATSYDSMYGLVNVHGFDTDDGAHLVWKSSTEIGRASGSKGCRIVDVGDRIKIMATIKDHKEYQGVEQTQLTRVKLLEGGRAE